MDKLKNIIITEIIEIVTLYSHKGKIEKISNRKFNGISFCSEGQITYTLDGKSFVSDKNHITFLPQGQSYTLSRDSDGVFYVINFKCDKPFYDSFKLFQTENSDIYIKDFNTMKKLTMLSDNHAKVMSVFYNLIQNIVSENCFCKTIAPAIRYIESNYKDTSITNETLAKLCNISEVYLRKLFNKHFKTTPKQYLCEIRLQNAKQLLSEGVLKISAIADECGFESSYNFCRFFKLKTGLTPTEYMRKNRIIKI